MSYAELSFWLFFALVLLGTAILPARLRPLWLIAASVWFYATPDPARLLWLGGVVLVTVTTVRRSPGIRKTAIASLAALLVWTKSAVAIGLPAPGAPPGFSFYTFTAIALLAESLRHRCSSSLTEAVLHLVWFPKLIAGPIERPQTLIPQFHAVSVRPAMTTLGFAFLLSGLVKKLVVADALAPLVDTAFAIPAHAAPVDLLLAAYFFAFQIYCDFSGYSDIAIGLSALVGLRLSRNFDRPYLSPTVTEFWSARWHITLGQWFRDHVYIPLGGSRKGRIRKVLNLMAVFLLSGLWHAGLGYGVGWGFVVWGLLNGVLVAVESFVSAPRRPLSRALRTLLTFHLILVTWIFFRASTLGDAMTILRRLTENLTALPGLIAAYPVSTDQWLALALIAALILIETPSGTRPIAERLAAASLPLRWSGFYAAMALLLLMGRWQDTGFIYAGF